MISNQVNYNIKNSVKIELSGVNNDEKFIYLQDKENYYMRISGTDTGALNVGVDVLAGKAIEKTISYNKY